jgi:predicted ATP-grasp superfamily ATP-dependent carboligase
MNGHPVIIIGCGVGGWGAMRSLAMVPGLRCVALSPSRTEMGWGSRYAAEFHVCPHPDTEEAAFIEFLMAHAREWEGALLLPAGDLMAMALSKHKETLEKAYRVAVGPWDAMRRFLEKDQLQHLAAEAGVPMPGAVRLSPGETRLPAIDHLQYPVWIKPSNSARFVRQYGRKGFLAADRAMLEGVLHRLRDAGQPLLLQEVILGGDDRYELISVYVTREGKPAAISHQRKLRQHPPGFGVMRVGYSVDQNPEAEELAGRLLRAVAGYRGLVYFEFKRDPRDGRLKLIEVNVRVARFGMLPTASGANYPELMYRDLVLGERDLVCRSRGGVWWIELLPDLYYTFFHRDGRQYGWADKLRPYRARHKVFGDFDRRDWRPFLRQWMRGVRALGHRAHGTSPR